MPTPSASEAALATPLDPGLVEPELVERFRHDLSALIDSAADRVVVALSGGADSIALLLLCRAVLADRCSAATVDHGLRAASADEARQAAALCERLGVAHAILTGPLPDRAGRTANLSARARTLRYGLLADHLAATGADWLATAHHADDQAETTLMRLNRGTGVAGLAGIRSSGWRLVRPLLGWRRAELAAIVAVAGIAPVDDPSNRDDRFARARLRKALGNAAWLDPAKVSASASALADAEEALAWSAQGLMAARVEEGDDGVTLDPGGVPKELVRRLLRACVIRVDPAAAPGGTALDRAATDLAAGRLAMLGDVTIEPGPRWRFRPAPPRRAPRPTG